MYAPPCHRVADDAVLLERMADIGFAIIVAGSGTAAAPLIAHAPIVIDTAVTPPRLAFHLARPNAAVKVLQEDAAAIVITLGPNHYVSPDWYETEDLVPTWNYIAVHAAGPVRQLEGAETLAHLDALSAVFESRLSPKPAWTTAKMTPRKLTTMLCGIVGFEMAIETLEGTAKLSQNRAPEDQAGVVRALEALSTGAAREIAALMKIGVVKT